MADKYNNTTRYLIADLILDVQRGELRRECEVITLPKLSYDLLVALAQAAPALLSQEELISRVWPERVIGDETLKQRIKLLRKSLGDDASAPQYIVAVRGRGYRLLPTVKCECVVRHPPSVMLDLSANDRFPSLTGNSFGKVWRRTSMLGLIFFIVAVIGITTMSMWGVDIKNNDSAFVIDEIQVVEKIKGNHVSVQQEHSLDNNVINNGINTLDAATANAQRLYLRGREYYHRYRKQDNDIAIEFFQKALAEDNSFARAYAGLSQAYSQQYFQFSGQETDKQLAIDNAYQALSYDNKSSVGYKALGTAYYVAGWLSKSIKTLRRGQYIEPNEIEILINLAFIHSEQGELKTALQWHKKILTQAPEHAVAMMHTGLTLQRAQQFNLAKMWYLRALNLQPDYMLTTYHLAQLAIAQQDYTAALTLVESQPDGVRQRALFLQIQADIAYYQGDTKHAQLLYLQAANTAIERRYSPSALRASLLAKHQDTKTENMITRAPLNSGEIPSLLIEQELIAGLKAKQQQGNEQADLSLLLAEVYSAKGQFTLAMRYLTQAIEQGYRLDYRVLHAPLFSGLREQANFKRLMLEAKEAISIDSFFER